MIKFDPHLFFNPVSKKNFDPHLLLDNSNTGQAYWLAACTRQVTSPSWVSAGFNKGDAATQQPLAPW